MKKIFNKEEIVACRLHLITFLILLPFISLDIGCKKLIEIPPPKGVLITKSVFANDQTATAAMAGLYIFLNDINYNSNINGGLNSIFDIGGQSSDELVNYQSDDDRLQVEQNAVLPTNSLISNEWASAYNAIYQCNAIIEGVGGSTGMTDAVKKQLIGEAKFIRAINYFCAVNQFGDVPLITTTNYVTNSNVAKTAKATIYAQIITDLKDAQTMLSHDYLGTDSKTVTTERTRVNYWAATALLARVYLYMNDWKNAGLLSDAVIKNTSNYSLLPDLNSVFLANSRESIWQLQPVNSGYDTNQVIFFAFNYFVLNSNLVNAFENGDQRTINKNRKCHLNTKNYTTFYSRFSCLLQFKSRMPKSR